jgi:hypothetical protein
MNETHLQRWTHPTNYIGKRWTDYYVFLAQNRDSDCLTQSNFTAGLAAIGGEQEGTVAVVSENHWLCGWVEWIAIHKDAASAVLAAEKVMRRLEDYPVLDDDDFARREEGKATAVWHNFYSPSERVAFIRKHLGDFGFTGMVAWLGCVRGRYFGGCNSTLLY